MPYQVLFTEDAERSLEDLHHLPAGHGGIQAAERFLLATE